MSIYTHNDFKITDHKVSKLSLRDLEKLYNKVSEQLDPCEFEKWSCDFWDAVNRVRSGANRHNMQDVVTHLENYKRRLGREFCKSRSLFVKQRYNEVELSIRWLVQQYEVRRTYKNYLL